MSVNKESIEMTAEQAAAMIGRSSLSPPLLPPPPNKSSSNSNSVAKKLGKLMSKNLNLRGPSKGKFGEQEASDYSSRACGGDSSSCNGEMSIGQMSVAHTTASIDTVKISNQNAALLKIEHNQRAAAEEDKGGTKHQNNPWRKFKKLMHPNRKVDKEDEEDEFLAHGASSLPRSHSKSWDFTPASASGRTNRRRTHSTDTSNKKEMQQQQDHAVTRRREKAILDDAVRGRLDGCDLLYLGPAYNISLQRQTTHESSTPWEPTPAYSFAGRSTQYTARQMVDDMMWRPTTGTQRAPEIVLEGFYRDDRWIVTLDVSRPTSGPTGCSKSLRSSDGDLHDSLPHLQLTDEEEASLSTIEDVPRHKLWGSMWGANNTPPPKPSHMSSVEDINEPDNVLEMAASCNVPIDIDEDTFMISNAEHLQSVHDLAAVPLQHGRFGEALDIFKKILKGVQIQETDMSLRHLEGVTLHNMAVIYMWQHKYEEALQCVGKAIKARLQYLPENHPDIGVSLARQGKCYFALERYGMAEASFQGAADIFNGRSVAKAKALLNLGVVKYQSGDDVEALKDFSDALEIQRVWLEGPVKREANVFGAAVMLGNMGKVHIKRGDYDLAISVYEEALLVRVLLCELGVCMCAFLFAIVCSPLAVSLVVHNDCDSF